jgi:hypothetical protein
MTFSRDEWLGEIVEKVNILSEPLTDSRESNSPSGLRLASCCSGHMVAAPCFSAGVSLEGAETKKPTASFASGGGLRNFF